MGKIFSRGNFENSHGVFSHTFKWDFFPREKFEKNKMCVLSRQSSLSAMHIAEKNCTAQFTSLIFPMGLFPILQYGKKIPWDFSNFQNCLFLKNYYEINSVAIYFNQNSEIIPTFQYLYFPVGNFKKSKNPMGFFPYCKMGKKSHGIFRFFKIAYF